MPGISGMFPSPEFSPEACSLAAIATDINAKADSISIIVTVAWILVRFIFRVLLIVNHHINDMQNRELRDTAKKPFQNEKRFFHEYLSRNATASTSSFMEIGTHLLRISISRKPS
jgi:hypothetical protein